MFHLLLVGGEFVSGLILTQVIIYLVVEKNIFINWTQSAEVINFLNMCFIFRTKKKKGTDNEAEELMLNLQLSVSFKGPTHRIFYRSLKQTNYTLAVKVRRGGAFTSWIQLRFSSYHITFEIFNPPGKSDNI